MSSSRSRWRLVPSFVLLLSLGIVARGAPANDNFTNAVNLTSTPAWTFGFNSGATAEPGEPQHAGLPAERSVWWHWTAPSSGCAQVMVTNAHFVARVSVYKGEILADLESVVASKAYGRCNVLFDALEGETYRIAVDSERWDYGSFDLYVGLASLVLRQPQDWLRLYAPGSTELEAASTDPNWLLESVEFWSGTNRLGESSLPPFTFVHTTTVPGPQVFTLVGVNNLGERRTSHDYWLMFRPSNDDLARATEIQPEVVTTALLGDIRYSSAEPNEPVHGNYPARRSLWWTWNPAYSGDTTFKIESASFSPILAIYAGDGTTNMIQLAQARYWDSCTVSVVAGLQYYIALDTDDYLSEEGIATWSFKQETMRLERPASGASLPATYPVQLKVDNAEHDHPFVRVEYLVNGVVIGFSQGPPDEFTWFPQEPGIYSLSAQGTNSLGELRQTTPVEVLVVPANDDFQNASVLPGDDLEISVMAPNRWASAEDGEPIQFPFEASYYSIWWQWTPTYSGQVECSVRDTSQYTIPGSVFVGDALDQLELVASNYGMLGKFYFEAQAGTNYFILVDNPGTMGNMIVELTLREYTLVLNRAGNLPLLAGTETEFEVVNYEFDHPVNNVEFLLGDEVIGTSSTPPHRFTWTAPFAGEYVLGVRGTNSLGELRQSSPVPWKFEPPNDSFSRSVAIPSSLDAVTFEGSTLLATHEPAEDRDPPALGSVWYSWIPPYSGDVFFSTAGSSSAPTVTLFSGESLDQLVRAYSPDTFVATVEAGVQYYLAVDAYWGNQGVFRITIHPPPPNDDFADALPLTGLSGSIEGNNFSATMEAGEPSSDNGGSSIWWKWRAPATGDLRIATSLGATVETAIYLGTTLEDLLTVAGPQVTSTLGPWGSGSSWDLICRVRAGVTYLLRFTGTRGNVHIDFNLTPALVVPPNDDFANRLHIQGMNLEIRGSNINGTRELGESLVPGGKGWTIWWSYVSPAQGLLELQIIPGSSWGQLMSAWRGTSLETLALAAYGVDTRLMLDVESGESLQIAFDSTLIHSGELAFSLRLHTPAPHDLPAQAEQVAGATASFQGNNLLAGLDAGEQPPAPDAIGKTLWYSWIAPTTGRVTLLAPYYVRIAVFSGSDQNNLTQVSVLPYGDYAFLAMEGVRYYFQVDTTGDSVGDFSCSLAIAPFVASTNDAFADALVLSGHAAEGYGTFLGATAEPGEPLHLGSTPFKSLWWSWQAPFDGDFWWTTEGSLRGDIVIAFYRGPGVDALTLVTKGTGSKSIRAYGGETYAIALTIPAGTESDVYLRLTGGTPSTPALIAGNLLRNPSFEDPTWLLTDWGLIPGGFIGYVGEPGGAHGRNWIAIPGNAELYQDIPTVPGRTYQIGLATYGQVADAWTETEVRFSGRRIGSVDYQTTVFRYWHWAIFTGTADGSTTRLSIRNLSNYTGIDGLSVVCLDDPPSILLNPNGSTVYSGSSATLVVGATGPRPLLYQWMHDGIAIPGATSHSLVLTNMSTADTGEYRVEVRNYNGAVTSAPATLTVIQADVPEITLQPWGDTAYVGEYYAFTVVAEGTAPLVYQWFKDSQPLATGTNRVFVLPAVALSDVGSYSVEISNLHGSVRSIPARLQVLADTQSGVLIWLANWYPESWFGLDFPVYDVDQMTLLTGEGYAAQLYAGPTMDRLRPCGEPSVFLDGPMAGRISPTTALVPGISPGADAYAQVRVWETQAGATYEEARARGGRFGRSDILHLTEVPAIPAASFLVGLPAFSLRSGLPEFYVGKIELSARLSEGSVEWRLIGQAGFRYLIEKSEGNSEWYPMLQVTAENDGVIFVDPAPAHDRVMFYRARILD